MFVEDVPFPMLREGYVLIRNHYSVISAGTEGKTVKDARAGYIEKAKSRKEEVKKVIKSVKTHGLKETYSLVKDRLESPSPLGYSCSGEVIEVGPGIHDLKKGDLVACGGSSANHAEVVAVPANLCAKLPAGVDPKYAAFTTIGAIAMQGVRQADLRLGENCVVIGVGLIGQLTLNLLEAAGVKAIGVDIDNTAIERVKELGFDAFLRADEQLFERVNAITNGYGTDAVIITAGSSSTDPVDLAGELCRVKGKVVVVGAVNTGFKRKPYYRKELDLRMSSSYGPGRYNPAYEEHGMDYPIGYVRWTEERNMDAFVDLLAQKKLSIAPLIADTYSIEDAVSAYDKVVGEEPLRGALLFQYRLDQDLARNVTYKEFAGTGKPVVGFLGAGKFARSFLLPNLEGKVDLKIVCNNSPASALNSHDKFGFAAATDNPEEVWSDKEVNTVFITSRHQSHADFVIAALKEDKQVFVEKPLCMSREELGQIVEVHGASKGDVMVGFNRRFAPFTSRIKEAFAGDLPKAMLYRVNAGQLPTDHWVHDIKLGGGRIIGEACHFIDYCIYMAGSKVKSVSAISAGPGNENPADTVTCLLYFEDGSIASINYFSNGNAQLPKEYFEISSGSMSASIDDFRTIAIYGSSIQKEKVGKQDKGFRQEVESYLKYLQGGTIPIPFEQSVHTMDVTFACIESLQNGGDKIVIQ